MYYFSIKHVLCNLRVIEKFQFNIPTNGADNRVGEVKTIVKVPLIMIDFVVGDVVDGLAAVFGEFF